MARIRRPRTYVARSAAASALCALTVGATTMALAPAAHASTTNSSGNTPAACPAADAAKTGPAQLPAGEPPKLRRDRILTVEDHDALVNVFANDGSSAGRLTLLAVSDPMHGDIAWNPNGLVTYRPKNGYVGFDQLNYTAGDEA